MRVKKFPCGVSHFSNNNCTNVKTLFNMKIMEKNFTYGDHWKSNPPIVIDKPRHTVDPREFTKDETLLKFVENPLNPFRVVAMYNEDQFAYTDFQNMEICINANYAHEIQRALFVHELGHITMFDRAPFGESLGRKNLRSRIVKVIYSPENLERYSFGQLAYIENIVQDIIIETVTGSRCVCSTMLSHSDFNSGVKHLEQLENVEKIAVEVCENQLDDVPNYLDEGLDDLFNSMAQAIKDVIGDLLERLSELKDSDYIEKELRARARQLQNSHASKLNRQIKNLQKKIEGAECIGKDSTNLRNVLETLENNLKNVSSHEYLEDLYQDYLEENEREIEKLEGDVEKLVQIQNGMKMSRERGMSTPSEKIPPFVCAIPRPLNVNKERYRSGDAKINNVDGVRLKSVRNLKIDREDVLSRNGQTSFQKESSYFKPNKREFDNTDMLRGFKKQPKTGLSVLIGLDVSGSMSSDWVNQFERMETIVSNIQDSIEIDNVQMFLYGSHIEMMGESFEELKPHVYDFNSGNDFPTVFQELAQTANLGLSNHIILVTDCGDALGFNPSRAVNASLEGEEVKFSFSVLNTDNGEFTAYSNIHPSWSFYDAGDERIAQYISEDVEKALRA